MKTEDLIAVLAADTAPQSTTGERMLRCLPIALMVTLIAVVALWRVRPDFATAMVSPALYKTIVPSVLALAALWLAHGMTRPESRMRARWALIGVLLAAWVVAFVLVLNSAGFSGLISALDTPNLLVCFVSIPILSALPLAAVFWAMKSGAPANPRSAGVAAGLLSGTIAAAVYSLHCPEDALLFFLPAYGIGVLIMAVVGGLLGPRLLRW